MNKRAMSKKYVTVKLSLNDVLNIHTVFATLARYGSMIVSDSVRDQCKRIENDFLNFYLDEVDEVFKNE